MITCRWCGEGYVYPGLDQVQRCNICGVEVPGESLNIKKRRRKSTSTRVKSLLKAWLPITRVVWDLIGWVCILYFFTLGAVEAWSKYHH